MLRNQISKKRKHPISYAGMFASAVSTLVNHPIRVGLNCAATTKNPLITLKEAKSVFFKGAHINLARGIFATGSQSAAKDFFDAFFAVTSNFGSLMCSIPASLAGLPATYIETFFMRNNAWLAQIANKQPIPEGFSRWKYNRHLALFYSIRELAFTVTVFGSNKASDTQRYATFIAATYVSSAAHKFAAIESTKDIRNIVDQVPNWQGGFREVFKKIIHNEYQLPALKGRFDHPKNIMQCMRNLVSITCHPNMFLWRIAYLYSFKNLSDYLRNQFENYDVNQNRFFHHANKKIESPKTPEMILPKKNQRTL